MKKKNPYKKKLKELTEKVHSREDLHEVYKEQIRRMLFDFVVDFSKMRDPFDPNQITLACLREFIKLWTDLHLKKGE